MATNPSLTISLLSGENTSHNDVGEVSIELTAKAWDTLNRIAEEDETSVEALLQGYIGRGLAEDIDSLMGSRLLAVLDSLLQPVVKSQSDVKEIINDLRLKRP